MAEHLLGRVTSPTGRLVVLDMGYLDLWSGADPPDPEHLPAVDDRMLRFLETATDLRIEGPDRERAARAFNRQSQTFLYDIPRHSVPQLRASFAECLKREQLDAAIVDEGRRVPHDERVSRAVVGGGADFIMMGVWVTAVGAVPPGPLDVVATSTAHDEDTWSDVAIRLRTGRVARQEKLGMVGVDWARLIVADPVALAAWEHARPLDGRADFAYWGARADEARAMFGGDRLPDGCWGWRDLGIREAVSRGEHIEAWAAQRGGLATDFRPHSHHWQMMEQVRATQTQSGRLTIAGADVVGFMTTIGDGVFSVIADRDAQGQLLTVRISIVR